MHRALMHKVFHQKDICPITLPFMTEKYTTGKRGRRKSRLPGTETPPRVSFSMRLEQSTFERLNSMLQSFEMSRNDYIARLIEHDLALRERMKPLNTPVRVDT